MHPSVIAELALGIHLLASTYLSAPARLWSRDKRLGKVAADLSAAH